MSPLTLVDDRPPVIIFIIIIMFLDLGVFTIESEKTIKIIIAGGRFIVRSHCERLLGSLE